MADEDIGQVGGLINGGQVIAAVLGNDLSTFIDAMKHRYFYLTL